ncbi:MAG: DUF4157 domain-containing protein [Saprospiraceae bacterium]
MQKITLKKSSENVVQQKAKTQPDSNNISNRKESALQTKRQEIVNNSNQVKQLKDIQDHANNSFEKNIIQKKANNSGLPHQLKSGIENLSGISMDDVKVHYNSSKPAQLQAHAYAQGTNIHLGSGQEKHLPHEAWHVVQQKQGRVRPTLQLHGGINVNDNASLEKEADVMGGRALQFKSTQSSFQKSNSNAHKQNAIQFHSMNEMGFEGIDYAVMSLKAYSGWKETIQAKKNITGTIHADNRVIVTQFNNSAEVAQMIKLSQKVKGGLLIAEGVLTAAAGTAGIFLSHGVGIVPGIIAIGIGISKITRGVISIKSGEKPGPKATVVLDALRAFEGVAALVGGILTGHPAAIVYGIAKSLRSLLTAITDYMGEDTSHPLVKKALKGISATLHVIETFAGMFGGIGALGKIGGSSTADSIIHGSSGVAALGVSLSKGYRAADQFERVEDGHQDPASTPILAQSH